MMLHVRYDAYRPVPAGVRVRPTWGAAFLHGRFMRIDRTKMFARARVIYYEETINGVLTELEKNL